MSNNYWCEVTLEQAQLLAKLAPKCFNTERSGLAYWTPETSQIVFYKEDDSLVRNHSKCSFEEMVNHVSSFFKKERVMKDVVVNVLCEEAATCLVELATNHGKKVDANRPWKKGLLAKVSGGVLSFGAFTRTDIYDVAVEALLEKKYFKLGQYSAKKDGNNVVIDAEGTTFTVPVKELQEALKYVKGFKSQGYNIGVVTKKNGDSVVGI